LEQAAFADEDDHQCCVSKIRKTNDSVQLAEQAMAYRCKRYGPTEENAGTLFGVHLPLSVAGWGHAGATISRKATPKPIAFPHRMVRSRAMQDPREKDRAEY
jgi:hypothetical protein